MPPPTEHAAHPPERFYRPELDGLRFAAFAAVFVHHAFGFGADEYRRLGVGAGLARALWATTEAGAFGVDLFFVLSAFLITELLLRERDAHGTLDAWRFYARRALRIWPLYFVFLAATLLVVPRLVPDSLDGHTAAFLLFVGNWSCAWIGYPASVAAPLWSISIEEQFYFLQPWIVRRLRGRQWIALVAALLVVAVAARAAVVLLGLRHPAMWCATLTRLDPIALGIALAIARRSAAMRKLWPRLAVAGPLVAAVAVPVVVWLVPVATWRPLPGQVWSYSAVALCATAIVAGTMDNRVLRALFSRPPLVFLGRISYGLYVFHLLGIAIAAEVLQGVSLEPISWVAARATLAFAFTVGLSVASWFVLEKPALRWKRRFEVVASRPVDDPAGAPDAAAVG